MMMQPEDSSFSVTFLGGFPPEMDLISAITYNIIMKHIISWVMTDDKYNYAQCVPQNQWPTYCTPYKKSSMKVTAIRLHQKLCISSRALNKRRAIH